MARSELDEDDQAARDFEKQFASMMHSDKRAMLLEGQGGIAAWKATYYQEKLELPFGTPPPVSAMATQYLSGLEWGIPAWVPM